MPGTHTGVQPPLLTDHEWTPPETAVPIDINCKLFPRNLEYGYELVTLKEHAHDELFDQSPLSF